MISYDRSGKDLCIVARVFRFEEENTWSNGVEELSISRKAIIFNWIDVACEIVGSQ